MKKYLLLICLSTLFSCSYKLSGTTYTGSGSYKSVSVNFVNDSLCEIQQIFFCKNIDTQYQKITIKAIYKRVSFILKYYKSNGQGSLKTKRFKGIIFSNIDCKSCKNSFLIPGFIQYGCLEKEDSIAEKLVPFENVNNYLHDTLLINNNVIYFGGIKALPTKQKK